MLKYFEVKENEEKKMLGGDRCQRMRINDGKTEEPKSKWKWTLVIDS